MEGQGDQPPHFLVVPFFAPGHMTPMVDIALLLAERGATVTVVMTPLNAERIRTDIDRAGASGLPIRFVEFEFPCAELGPPEGGENADLLPSQDMIARYFYVVSSLKAPLVEFLREQRELHPPSCMISDWCQPWTRAVADEFGIPRLSFQGTSCFSLLCMINIQKHRLSEDLNDEATPFVIPGLPHRIDITSRETPRPFLQRFGFEKLEGEIAAAEETSDGVVFNSFDELEPLYMESFRQVTGKKAWAIGPVCLYNNRDVADRAARGNKPTVDSSRCLSWLDSMKPGSVVYASFGSLTKITPPQLIEIGMGLEASGHPFIWVIKDAELSPEVEKWLLGGFQERTKGRSLVIRGWAPQVAILSHPAAGVFVSHCGWNSSVEGIAAGVPMVTWPHFAEQFLNEKMIVDVLGVGVPVGVKGQIEWGSEEPGELVKREAIEAALREVMDGGVEGQERRERARLLGKRARMALEVGGSSHANIGCLIQEMSLRQAKSCNDRRGG